MPFNSKTLNDLVLSISNGGTPPNATFASIDFTYQITALHAALIPDYTVTSTEQLELVKRLLALGCAVDILTDQLADTPLEYAAKGAKFLELHQIGRLVNLMLPLHKKGTRDAILLQCVEQSKHYSLFNNIIETTYIDVNDAEPTTKNTILHYLAMTSERAGYLGGLLKIPSLNLNPVNLSGETPFTVALNTTAMSGVIIFSMDGRCKVVGKLNSPEFIIDYNLVDKFEGHFFKEYPEMLEYAIKKGAYGQMPENAADIFCF